MHRQAQIKENLELRARIFQAIRAFFLDRGYLEVDTPVRVPTQAPEEHIDAEPSGNWFLQTSPELCMKRLLAAGYSRLFQLCRCFRKAERGRRHLPEFTLLEWYTAGDDYAAMMKQTEELIVSVSRSVAGGQTIEYLGQTIDLRPPWERLPVRDAFKRYAGADADRAVEENRFDQWMVDRIEPDLPKNRPVFLVDYPAALGALARLKPDDPAVAERFELYIGGLELCNAFTELIDPVEQKTRFITALGQQRKAGKIVYPMPEKFLAALEHMPPAAGNALGVDRLVMLFAGAADIDGVTAFVPEEL